MKNIGSFLAFNQGWFDKHQTALIWLLNNKLTKTWFRYVLRIDCSLQITEIGANHFSYGDEFINGRLYRTTDFRTHPKYGKRIYYAFWPIWWLIHVWDLFADRAIPQWSYGFSTLTVYPDADPETTTVDGHVGYSDGIYADVRVATDGNSAVSSGTLIDIMSRLSGGVYTIRRGFTLFDTSALTAGASVSGAVISLSGSSANYSNSDTTSINAYAATPASNTDLTTADFDQVGSTTYATAVAIADLVNGYNAWTFNATGLAAVSLTGITKIGWRIVEKDVTNSAPTGTNLGEFDSADVPGTTSDPKLVVTYSVSSPSASASNSASASRSPSASLSPSSSASASQSPSASRSPSASLSPSASRSPSSSASTSSSASQSPSASRSPSASASFSLSPSASASSSLSPSSSVSPSPSPPPWDNQVAHQSTWSDQSQNITTWDNQDKTYV